MKFLALLFLVGFASASFYDVLDEAADEIVRDFMVGMENAPSLKDALQLSDTQAAEEVEDDVKTELGKKLKETLDHILEKIKEAIDQGKTVKQGLLEKLKEVKEKMKELHIDISEKTKEMLEKVKEKVKDFFKKLLEKLVGIGGDKEERSIDELDELLRLNLNMKDLWKELKKAVLSKINKEALKEKVEKLFGKGSEIFDQLVDIIKKKGEDYKQKLLDFIDKHIGNDENDRKRSVSDLWQKVKDYFDNLKIEMKEKYIKFGEWIKEVIGKGLDSSKSRLENLKKIAKELMTHMKELKKDVAAEALEFLRPYKEDLGDLYEQVKVAVKDILSRKD